MDAPGSNPGRLFFCFDFPVIREESRDSSPMVWIGDPDRQVQITYFHNRKSFEKNYLGIVEQAY